MTAPHEPGDHAVPAPTTRTGAGGPEVRDLRDGVVVVTGAGSGIGRATTEQLLAAGARVVAADLRPGRLDDLLGREGGERLVVVGGDVGEPGHAERLVAAGTAAWGRVDSVVANAGVGHFGGLLDQDEDQVLAMVATNFTATVWLSRAALRRFRAQGDGGDVVVVGSVAGLGPGGGEEAVYAGTKAAQMQLATSLDRETRHEGIRATVVAPAAVNTSFAAATGRFGDAAPEDGDFLRPDDVAAAVVTVLRQPRRMRTGVWTLWSLAESGG